MKLGRLFFRTTLYVRVRVQRVSMAPKKNARKGALSY